MPEGVVLHREKPPASGTWSPRPAALAGITPVAVLVYGNFDTNEIDGVNSVNASFFSGFSDGVISAGLSNHQVDAAGSSNTRYSNTRQGLCYGADAFQNILLDLGNAAFVSGGMDVTVNANTTSPYVNCIFFYGDDWQAYCDRSRISNVIGGVVTATTGFTGTNENQILFTLPCRTDICTITPVQAGFATNFGFGVAVRQGASTVPLGQVAWSGAPRDGRSTCEIGQTCENGRVHTPCSPTSKVNAVECTRIDDSEIDFTTRDTTTRRGFYLLVISTGSKKCWAGRINSPNVSGNWIVSAPAFQPEVVSVVFNQTKVDAVFENDDIAIGGMTAGTDADEFSSIWSDEDGVGTMVAKSRINSQFLDVIQDNGNDGWKSGPNDFSLTSSGFRVDNVTVSAGAPATVRLWTAWAIEGEAGGGQEYNLDADDLAHGHPVDVANLTPSTYRLFGEDLLHVQPIGDAPVTKIVGLAPNGLVHSHPVEIINLVQQIEGVLNPNDLLHVQEMESGYFGRYLRSDDLDHGHPIGQTPLTLNRGLLANDLLHLHSLEDSGLQSSPNFPLNTQNLIHVQLVDSADLPKISTLVTQDLDHVHFLENNDLRIGGQSYPYINPNEGMLVFTWKPRYDKSDIASPQGAMALVGLQASIDVMFRLFYDVISALESLDGTSVARVNLDGGAGPRANITYRCALWWDNGNQRRQVGYKPEDGGWVWGSETTYDGRFGEGALRVFYNNEYPQLISDIVIYDENRGRSFIESLPLEF